MKLRCVNNSIRLRLRKSEIDQLRLGNAIQEEVGFPGETPSLFFSLQMNGLKSTLSASFENNNIRIDLPRELASKWIDSEEVSIEDRLPIDTTNELHVLIEKDFPCKDRENEDKSDLFGELAAEGPKAC